MSGPFEPYYDPSPRQFLTKPLALCGYFGSNVPALAFTISTHLGLPLHDIERYIEHEIGCRLAEYEYSITAIEKMIVTRSLKQRPHGILMLRPQTLQDITIRNRLKEETLLVYLHRDIFVLYSNILDLYSKNDHSRYHHLIKPLNISNLQLDLNAHKQGYQVAHHTIRARNQHPSRLYSTVLGLIDAIS